MPTSQISGMVQTVLGPVNPDSLGPTLTHEHLLLDHAFLLEPSSEATAIGRAYEPVTENNIGWLRLNPYQNFDNRLLIDEETAISEALLFKLAGGGAIVDATSIGIGRDPLALARIARATGVNIIMGAGYYRGDTHPKEMDELTESDLVQKMIDEIRNGVGDTGVRPGIIGEIGCDWPLKTNERKVLKASAKAQRETGAPLLIHPGGGYERSPHEILDLIGDAGADISRTIIAHLDRTIFDFDVLLKLARSGCYLEYDVFGTDSKYYPPQSDIDMPSDAQRLDIIKRLISEGYGNKIVVAHDICHKDRLEEYGGHGLAHILENVVPRMRRKGFSADDINSILIANPARILAFA